MRGPRIDRWSRILLLILFLKPIVRFLLSFIYYFILRKLFGSSDFETLYEGFSFAFDSLESSSSWTEDSFGINVLLEPEPLSAAEVALSNFRAQNAAIEAELFSRIRGLEAQLAHGLPPQINPGEYEHLVRENVESAVSVDHYRETLNLEFWEVQIMGLKIQLQDLLFNQMIGEPRIENILNQSPYGDIRSAAFEFIEEKVEPVSAMQHGFQRHLLEGTLHSYLRDIEEKGANASIYKQFYAHFTDEEFLQKTNLGFLIGDQAPPVGPCDRPRT